MKNEFNKIRLIEYSERSIAVLGNTYPIMEQLKKANARFNRHLKIDGKFVWGWIASIKQKKIIEKIINDYLNSPKA